MKLFWRKNINSVLQPDLDPQSEETGVIHMDSVYCAYKGSTENILASFNLMVRSGEFVTVLGKSGVGKTTILRAIAGLERINSGYVRVGGQLASSSFVHSPPDKRRVGLVFQDYALFPHMTVFENVGFGLRTLNSNERTRRVLDILELADIKLHANRYVNEISGGEQQSVAIARALAPNPLALLLDEPYSNLDLPLRDDLRKYVKRIVKQTGATTILVTHDGEEALAHSDRVAIMGRGSIKQIGTPQEVYQSPVSEEVASLLGPCEFVPGVVNGKTVETEIGVFKLTPDIIFKNGTRVNTLIRPSKLGIVPLNSNVDLGHKVEFKEYHGEFTEYGVKLKSELVIRVRLPIGGEDINVGQLVKFNEFKETVICYESKT